MIVVKACVSYGRETFQGRARWKLLFISLDAKHVFLKNKTRVNKGSWNFEVEKSLRGFHFHMVINHLRRLRPPPLHPPCPRADAHNRIGLANVSLLNIFQALKSGAFSSEKADEMQRQKTDESSWLSLLSGVGGWVLGFPFCIALWSWSELAGGPHFLCN